MRYESNRLIAGIGRLESEVLTLQARLDQQRAERQSDTTQQAAVEDLYVPTDVDVPTHSVMFDEVLADEAIINQMLGDQVPETQPAQADEAVPAVVIAPAATAISNVEKTRHPVRSELPLDLTETTANQQTVSLAPQSETEAAAFDQFFDAPDDDLDRERKFLLD